MPLGVSTLTYPPLFDTFLVAVKEWTCDAQFAFARQVASNVGYKLVPEDSIQAAEDHGDLVSRIEKLEADVHRLNIGLKPKR